MVEMRSLRVSIFALALFCNLATAQECDNFCPLIPLPAQNQSPSIIEEDRLDDQGDLHLLRCVSPDGSAESHVVVGTPTAETTDTVPTIHATELKPDGKKTITLAANMADCSIEPVPGDKTSISSGRRTL